MAYEHIINAILKYLYVLSEWFLNCILVSAYEMGGLKLELKVCLSHVDGPGELVPLGLIVDFFYRYLHVLTPEQMGKKRLLSIPCKINILLNPPVNLLMSLKIFSLKEQQRSIQMEYTHTHTQNTNYRHCRNNINTRNGL